MGHYKPNIMEKIKIILKIKYHRTIKKENQTKN